MTDDAFHSSDSVRTDGPLKHTQTVTFDRPVALELGGRLPGVTVAYETYGRLNEAQSNAVLICHGLSGDSHVAAHDADDDPGWWDVCVGPGKPIDTDRHFVICPNVLGGCRGSTGPSSINPDTGQPYGADFPTITINDMVDAQRMLMDHLGIDSLLAVVGGSMGGQMVMSWAIRYPDHAVGFVPLATAPRVSSQALAFDVVGRNAILHDPNFAGGQYYDQQAGPTIGLALARMIAHVTYLSRESMAQKFDVTRYQPRDVPVEFEKTFSVGSYLGYLGAKFVGRFDPNSYMAITMAIDLFDLGATAEQLMPLFANVPGRWLIVSFSSDWLFPPRQSRTIVRSLLAGARPVSYCNITSSCGHDAFLLADDVAIYGELIRGFLNNLNGGENPLGEQIHRHGRGSIFAAERLDYDHIVDLIEPGASVLDLGCGTGAMLGSLQRRGHEQLVGVEIDEHAILECIRAGLDVIHADLENDLDQFGDKQFDCVVLSRTLQVVHNVQGVMDEMLRIGRQCVVSFPNFGYHKLRKMLAEQGRAPEAGVLRHKWYNTPNLRFLSVADFEDFCSEHGITVHVQQFLDTELGVDVVDDPNLNADLAIFVISR
ncbi:hypothetical protein LCGC14_0489850 [marine sediment metagenome]|uniref:AB hydrolase-1 domain-containing protein n=1 Tax=marine sediment metagenome TaxID=412755 RepID=A0A0F9SQ48_9ZZZZ